MLHLLARQLQSRLPLYLPGCIVEYGTRVQHGDAMPVATYRVSVARDPTATELIAAPSSATPARAGRGKHVRNRTMNGVAKIFARAEVAEAMQHENEAYGDWLVDATIAEIDGWASQERLMVPVYVEARPMNASELQLELGTTPAGFGYLLRFSVVRGVYGLPPRTAQVHAVETAPPGVLLPGQSAS